MDRIVSKVKGTFQRSRAPTVSGDTAFIMECLATKGKAGNLAQYLKKTGTTKLDFGDQNLGADGARRLAKALQGNATVVTLNLRKAQIGGAEGAVYLADALKRNTTLEELQLGGCDIGNKGAIALAEALTNNSNMRILSLGGNGLDNACTQALVTMVNDCGLTGLSLRWNHFSPTSQARLLDAQTRLDELEIKLDSNVPKIDQRSNFQGADHRVAFSRSGALPPDDDAIADVAMLCMQNEEAALPWLHDALAMKHKTMLKLGELAPQDVPVLARWLATDPPVASLSFSVPGAGAGAARIADALQRNTHLSSLTIHDTKKPADDINLSAFANTLEVNHWLTELKLDADYRKMKALLATDRTWANIVEALDRNRKAKNDNADAMIHRAANNLAASVNTTAWLPTELGQQIAHHVLMIDPTQHGLDTLNDVALAGLAKKNGA